MTNSRFNFAVRRLDRQAFAVQTALDVWLFRHGKRGNYRKVKRMNAYKLLKLQVWAGRHRISIDEVVDILIPAFNKFQWGGRAREKWGTNISIATLTSNNAERILAKEIELRYPENEHRMIWRQQIRQEQLDKEKAEELDGLIPHERGPRTMIEAASAEEFVTAYRARATKQREEHESQVSQSWRRRKAYRANPWRG